MLAKGGSSVIKSIIIYFASRIVPIFVEALLWVTKGAKLCPILFETFLWVIIGAKLCPISFETFLWVM